MLNQAKIKALYHFELTEISKFNKTKYFEKLCNLFVNKKGMKLRLPI